TGALAGQDLPRVEQVLGVQSLLDRPHGRHPRGADLPLQVVLLGQAHPVLTGDGPAQLDGRPENVLEGSLHPGHLLPVPLVGEAGGGEVAVARVARGGRWSPGAGPPPPGWPGASPPGGPGARWRPPGWWWGGSEPGRKGLPCGPPSGGRPPQGWRPPPPGPPPPPGRWPPPRRC